MFKSINLEMSLKPFKKVDNDYIENVIRGVFEQWRPLLKNRENISIMFWTADGSEILDYNGNLSDKFEWCQFIGGANHPYINEGDSIDVNLHTRKFDYMKNPPTMTYGILKNIISAIKRIGKEMYPNSNIRVGETFDIGPEFARSSFKYERHLELCSGEEFDGKMKAINSYGKLKGDSHSYAAYPNGIPDGTPFGEFLGKQANIFLRDMGFDYLWLSNGAGFSATPWTAHGAVFDGKIFHENEFDNVKKTLFAFWQDFRRACPDIPLMVRGTNYSAGIDYSSDAVPLYDIYNAGFNITPPPNSPWAALDSDFGLELMGHMTRIAELPCDEFLFRYYIHDPWWTNSPWYDRYEGQPHDIYLPMAISRVDEQGKTRAAELFNVLSIDNSYGNLPDSCVNEPLPHILKAEKDSADEPANFVWVYPFREYTTTKDKSQLRKIMTGDWFICEAISNGMPISTIVSCDNFLKHDDVLYKKSILVTPVPIAKSEFEDKIIAYVEAGGKVIFYGSADGASEKFKNTFALVAKEARLGEFSVDKKYFPDKHRDGVYPETLDVREFLSNGALNVESKQSIIDTEDGYSLAAEYKNAVWYRATVGGENPTGKHIEPDDASKYVRGEALIRSVLKKYGYEISFSKPTGNIKTPVIMTCRSNNGEVYSIYTPSTTVEVTLRHPLGAPILNGYEAELKDGAATYKFPRAEHRECRVFVEQNDGIVYSKEHVAVSYKYRRKIKVGGLKNATVRFFGEKYCEDEVKGILGPTNPEGSTTDRKFDWSIVKSEEFGTYYEVRNVSGEILFCMPYPDRINVK